MNRLSMMAAVVLAASSSLQAAFTSYHIGNSLTVDARPSGIKNMAAAMGIEHIADGHIRCGSSLTGIWNNPDDVCVDPNAFGTFGEALTNHSWDALVIQPYSGTNFGNDRTAINSFINLANNTDTRVLIYAAWTSVTTINGDFGAVWNAPATSDNSQTMNFSRQYFYNLVDAIRQDNPGVTVDLIPVGEVLYRVDTLLKSGDLVIADVATVDDLYRDNHHMGAIGRYIAALTHVAVLHGKAPIGVGVPSIYGDTRLTDDLQAQLQGIVWDVVVNESYTGVPEPASITLLMAGGTLLMRRARR